MKPPIPNAKFDNIVVQEFSDEILIYNLKTNRAYSLNETSTLVWRSCDGTKTVSQIAEAIERQLDQHIPEDLVWLALDNLKREELISFNGNEKAIFTNFNRRQAIKRVGLVTMAALPFLVSISAPTASQAQSEDGTCMGCIVDLGIDMQTQEPLGVCPDQCAGLRCTCYINNSCMGVGGQVLNVTCEACREIDNPDKNNSWRCDQVGGGF